MRNNVIVFILTVFSALVFSETINFDINDYTFSADSLTVSYKEKTYRNIAPFGRTLPAVFQEYRFESSYSEAVVINSYDSVLVDPDLGIEYFNGNTLVFGKKFPRKPINIGARGIKRHGGFSVIEKNPFFIYNDSLFFVTSVNFDFTGRKNIETDLVKNQSYTKIDLIIITPEEFAPSFEVYKSFKTKQGLIAEIRTTEDIYAEYPGESDVIKIRNFIKDKYVQNDLEYVIIGGGYKTVPVGKALPYVSAYTGEIYTDSFYSKLDGEIDANGNGIYFEYNDYADPYEDVYVGRFPGNTAEEISAIINKTISYYSADRGYRVGFNPSVFLLGMDVFNTGDGRKWCNNVKTEFSESFTIDSLYEGVSSGFSRTGIFEKLNAGYNFVYSQSHGDYHVIRQKDNQFKIWSDDILNLGTVSGLFYIAACEPGNYSSDSFSHKAMVNPEGGCVTYVGSGGEEFPSTTDNFNAYFFRQINRGRTYGLALAESKVIYGNILSSSYGLYTSHTYSIQGDPSNKPFLREPKNIEITASGPIRKGKGSVDFTFSIQPEDTVFVTLTEGDRILSAKKTISQNFTIDYQDVTSDSLYLNYYSQECFFKSAKYSTVSAEEISFKIENLTVQDANVSGIAEDGESFGMNFKFTLNSNPAGIDSLVAVVAGSDHSGINIINGQKRFRLPSAGSYTSIGAFSMKFTSPDPVISDSVAVTDLEIRKKDGSVLFAQKVYVPVSVPYLKLHSFERNGNTLSPKFANVRKGKINTAKIDLLEYAKQDLQQDALKFYERATVTLRNITGFKIVSDSVNFDIDSTKIYKLAVTINGGKIYYSGDFGFTSQQEQPVLLYADHSPGKVNLEWKHSFSDVCGVNVYSFQDALLSNPVLRNFERIDGSKFSFIYDTADPVYVSVAFTDSSGYEFYMSQSVRVEPIPLYRNKTYKVAPFQIYNPVFIDGKLISNSLNSSVGGINSDGSYINGTGLVHESGINGFSLNAQQGFAVGDINSDGRQDMVNYSYNMGDSVLVKAIDLTTGDIIAQKKIYGHIMENAPVLANADDDSDLEIFISVFNGNIGGTPAKGSYVYMLDYNAGSFDIAPGFPIFSSASSYTIHSPSVLDLNNDGTKELIFNCGVKILVYSVQGPAKIAEYSLPKTISTSLSFCDIDSDGDLEIFALTESYGTYGKLFALSFNGTSLSVLPETSGGLNIDMKNQAFLDLTPPVSFADIDGDGRTEIIAVTASKIYIYNDDFSNYGNFPVSLDSRVTENNLSAPSIADFDGDGRLDILFMDSNYRIWCYSGSSGGILPGFPLQIKDMDRDELTSPAVADLDGDGDLEFAIGTRDGVMIVYDYPYKSSGMPVLDNYRGDLYNSGLFTPLVPSSPGNVSISVSGQGIMLSWDAVPGVSSYSVYSSDNPYGNFVYEGQSAGPDYTVYGLTENKKFFYIKAVR